MDYSFIRELIGYFVAAGAVVLLWGVLTRLASTKVEVKVIDEKIVLKTNKNTIILHPYICISAGHKRKRVLSVGEEIFPKEKHTKVSLLGSSGELRSSEEYYECLSAFFRFAFIKLIDRKVFVLPKISLVGAENFKYESEEIDSDKIYKSFRQAGAIECKFLNQ